jgi:hypothetical protein
MFFTDLMSHCTTRIECTFADGKSSTGTGFFMTLCESGDRSVPVLVTNKHVVMGAQRGTFWLTLRKSESNAPDIGKHHSFELPNFASHWHYHPALDLAVMPINPLVEQGRSTGHEYFLSPLSTTLIPTQADLADIPALMEVVLVGYPNGLWDKTNNQPLFRSGITATHPELNYNGKPEFLIDAACFNGSSGSPVFLAQIGRTMSRSKGITIGPSVVKLLGVLYAGPMHMATGEIVAVPIGTRDVVVTAIPNNLGIVISAKALLDFEPVLNYLATNQRRPGRNELCPCGSEKKYKDCHGVVV